MIRSVGERASFTALLGVLGTVLVVGPFLAVHSSLRFWLGLITIVAMIGAVLRLSSKRWVRSWAVAIGIGTVAISALGALVPSDASIIGAHVGIVVFVLLVAVTLTNSVWSEREVTADTIAGGIVVYILLAVAWSSAYQAVEFASPGSFLVNAGSAGNWGPWEPTPGTYPRLLFFSFVTLTTLGYGDLVPASIGAAGLATAEAIVGPLYLTILIARLVGLHLAGSRRAAGDSEPRG